MEAMAYQQSAEKWATVPAFPGSAAFHTGFEMHDRFVQGYLRRDVGRAKKQAGTR